MESCPFCGSQLITCGCAQRHFYPDYDFGKEPFHGLPEEVFLHGLSDEQQAEWDGILEQKGRIPYIVYPNLCCRCGSLWPDMFHVPDEEWEHYIEPTMQGEMLCKRCYEWIRDTIDRAHDATTIEDTDEDEGPGEGPSEPTLHHVVLGHACLAGEVVADHVAEVLQHVSERAADIGERAGDMAERFSNVAEFLHTCADSTVTRR